MSLVHESRGYTLIVWIIAIVVALVGVFRPATVVSIYGIVLVAGLFLGGAVNLWFAIRGNAPRRRTLSRAERFGHAGMGAGALLLSATFFTWSQRDLTSILTYSAIVLIFIGIASQALHLFRSRAAANQTTGSR